MANAATNDGAWCRTVDRAGQPVLEAGGRWTVFNLRALLPQLTAATRSRKQPTAIDASALELLDTAGALELLRLSREAGNLAIEGAKPKHEEMLKLVAKGIVEPQRPRHHSFILELLEEIGEGAVHVLEQTARLLGFCGEVAVALLGAFLRPRRFRPAAVVVQMREVWIKALPIVAVLIFLIGIVLAYQGVQQLRQFGAEIFTVEAVGIAIFRELGVLLTAIIVAGRSGSAFTAQIGTMQVNLEIDAMRTLGLNPIEWLVLPRIVALTLSMPLLVFFGNMAGVLGGAFASTIYLDLSLSQFFARMRDTVGDWNFYIGMIKAPVFAFMIAAIGCYEGLQVTGSAESVGKQTTKSVVEAIFMVIVLDAIFSVIFLLAGV
jgi:phospholipid/cholesterol/gamma-HCH transport system permease protein